MKIEYSSWTTKRPEGFIFEIIKCDGSVNGGRGKVVFKSETYATRSKAVTAGKKWISGQNAAA